MNLELHAMCWLRSERNCMLVLRERSPRYCLGQPDVIGVTAGRYLIEVEIKRSMADFYADQRKRHRRNRTEYVADYPVAQWPKEFWYLSESGLAAKMSLSKSLPEYAGVLSTEDCVYTQIMKPCVVNKASGKLSVKECVRLARQMTNHLVASELRYDRAFGHYKNGWETFVLKGTRDWQI